MNMPTKDEIDDVADKLIAAANYIKDKLEAGDGVLESKWLGAVMSAHEMLLDFAETADVE